MIFVQLLIVTLTSIESTTNDNQTSNITGIIIRICLFSCRMYTTFTTMYIILYFRQCGHGYSKSLTENEVSPPVRPFVPVYDETNHTQ